MGGWLGRTSAQLCLQRPRPQQPKPPWPPCPPRHSSPATPSASSSSSSPAGSRPSSSAPTTPSGGCSVRTPAQARGPGQPAVPRLTFGHCSPPGGPSRTSATVSVLLGSLTVALFLYVLLLPLIQDVQPNVRSSPLVYRLLTRLTALQTPQFRHWRQSGVLSSVIPVRRQAR